MVSLVAKTALNPFLLKKTVSRKVVHMKIIPKWVIRAMITELTVNYRDILQSYMHISHLSSRHAVTSKCISEHTEPSQHRLPHYHTGLVFEDEGEDEDGNVLGDASLLHTSHT